MTPSRFGQHLQRIARREGVTIPDGPVDWPSTIRRTIEAINQQRPGAIAAVCPVCGKAQCANPGECAQWWDITLRHVAGDHTACADTCPGRS